MSSNSAPHRTRGSTQRPQSAAYWDRLEASRASLETFGERAMTRVLIALSALFAIAACSTGGGGNSSNSTGANATGGTSSATGGAYTFIAADTADAGMQSLPIAMAVGPSDQVGVAYFRPTGNSLAPTGDAGGRVDYGVMYLEITDG